MKNTSRICLFLAYLCLSNAQPIPAARNSSLINAEILEKWTNATEPSYLYVVQLELKASRVEESFVEIEKRLDKLVETAFVLASYKHRKQTPPAEITTSDSTYSTRIIKKRTNGDLTYIHFVTYAGNEPVLGEVVAEDMTLLTVSQISAMLRYPLGRIVSDRDIENESATKWWFLIAVIGTGVIIIVIGWFFLFLFYNTCGSSYGSDEGDYMTRGQRATMRKELIIDPPEIMPESAAEQPVGVPSDGSNPSVTTGKPRLNKKTARSMRTLSEIHLEKRIKNERENIRKAIQEAFSKAVAENEEAARVPLPSSFGRVADTENTDVEKAQSVVRSEKKRRHKTKIGPITTTTLATTTTTNEEKEQGETSEISGVSSRAETMSTPAEDEFDVDNLPETTLKLVKKAKYQTECDVRSEPESDYGSSLDEEKPKADEIDEKRKEEGFHDESRVRPMTAKKQRTSLFGGSGISPIPIQPRAWTVYSAGDTVAEYWNTKRVHDHPTPSSPSDKGVIEVKALSAFRF